MSLNSKLPLARSVGSFSFLPVSASFSPLAIQTDKPAPDIPPLPPRSSCPHAQPDRALTRMAKLPQSSFALDFLRRLLCAHTAPGGDNAARRDDGADAAALLREKAYEGASPARSPCIVARLMGLDAMPTPARDQQQTPQTLRRSRSASSAEGLSPPPPTPCCSPRPRVARTASASFGDRPTYLRRENDEFLLLSFSPDDADDLSACFSPASRGRADALVPGRKQRQRRRHGESGRSRRQAAKAEESGMENSSPVSVLDAQEESSATATTSSSSSSSTEEAEQCSPTSDGEEIRLAPRQEQGSRRKLPQPPFEDLGGHLPPEAVYQIVQAGAGEQ